MAVECSLAEQCMVRLCVLTYMSGSEIDCGCISSGGCGNCTGVFIEEIDMLGYDDEDMDEQRAYFGSQISQHSVCLHIIDTCFDGTVECTSTQLSEQAVEV